MSITPFTVHVAQETLDDLRARLAQTRWPDAVSSGWEYGTAPGYLRELVAYWQDGFDWRAQEAKLNQWAHYRVEIDGVGIHCIHERGAGDHPLPLLLLHGWPSSFLQMLNIIPMLTDPARYGGDAADAFDVIVPSLPGYGFSDRPTQPGMSVWRMADLMVGMIQELGYPRYALRGSDIGAGVAWQMALASPQAVIGYHFSGATPPYATLPVQDLTEAEQRFMMAGQQWAQREGAYAMLQSTKPQTLAYGLHDSPAGLAAWIVEKFRTWSDCEGDVERRFSKDELLTNITLYWVTGTINSSIRVYYENVHTSRPLADRRVEVPTAIAILPQDLLPPVRAWEERWYNLHRWTELPRGGHFAEWEEPELLADDLRAFFRPLRG